MYSMADSLPPNNTIDLTKPQLITKAVIDKMINDRININIQAKTSTKSLPYKKYTLIRTTTETPKQKTVKDELKKVNTQIKNSFNNMLNKPVLSTPVLDPPKNTEEYQILLGVFKEVITGYNDIRTKESSTTNTPYYQSGDTGDTGEGETDHFVKIIFFKTPELNSDEHLLKYSIDPITTDPFGKAANYEIINPIDKIMETPPTMETPQTETAKGGKRRTKKASKRSTKKRVQKRVRRTRR